MYWSICIVGIVIERIVTLKGNANFSGVEWGGEWETRKILRKEKKKEDKAGNGVVSIVRYCLQYSLLECQ